MIVGPSQIKKHGDFESIISRYSGLKHLTPSKIRALNAALSDEEGIDDGNELDMMSERGSDSEEGSDNEDESESVSRPCGSVGFKQRL